MISKRKIIYSLVVVVVTLLIINVLLGLTQKKAVSKTNVELSKLQIEEKFLSVLDRFGIEQSWIAKNKLKTGKYDSLNYQFNIQVPSGVPIPVVLKDLNEVFLGQPAVLKSDEQKVDGFTNFTIKSGKYVKLVSEFKYNHELSRQFSQIGFLLTDFEDIEESKLQTLFDLAIPVGIILPLENESRLTAELIKSHNFEYFIELDNDSDNLDFELDEDLDLQKLNSNIINIVSSFNSPKVFFINETSSGFNNSLDNYISEGFQKKGRKILFLNRYLKLKGENEADLVSLLKFHLNKMSFGNSKIFRISIADWFVIQDELNKFLKKGNKILAPTKIF